jgi:hypothetical protein
MGREVVGDDVDLARGGLRTHDLLTTTDTIYSSALDRANSMGLDVLKTLVAAPQANASVNA